MSGKRYQYFLRMKLRFSFPAQRSATSSFFHMFGTHSGMNVVSDFMKQDMADRDLPKQSESAVSGTLQIQEDLVHTKFDRGLGVVPTRVITAKNSNLVDFSSP